MKWKSRFWIVFCFVATVGWTAAVNVTQVTEVTEATEATSTDQNSDTDGFQLEQHPTACYVEKSKVSELLVRMNSTVRHLNRGDKYLDCPDQMGVIKEDVTTSEICSETRIAKIQEELDDVTAEIIEMATGLSNLTEDEYDSLNARKFKLIDNLNALNVMYVLLGPCDTWFAVRYPIRSLVEFVEYNMNGKLYLYHTTRPKRQPTTTTPLPATTASTTPKPTVDDMLKPEKSLTELNRLAHANPSAMSTALPRIISQRYNRRMSTFDSLLTFLEGLPTAENRIIGVSSLLDEMHRYNRDPDATRLKKVARVVQSLWKSTPPHLLDETTSLKLTDLFNDPDLEPFIFRIDRQMSFTKLTEKARLNSTAMSTVLTEIISQRYNASDSSFDAFINFVEGLPASENKIVGYTAIYGEMQRCNQSADAEKLAKIANAVHRLDRSLPKNQLDADASAKLHDLVNDLILVNLKTVTSQATFAQLTEIARSNPDLMSTVLPDIVSQRYNASVPFDSIFNFIDNLSTAEHRVVGFAAVYENMKCCGRTLDLKHLIKLVQKTKTFNETESASLKSAAKSKLADLLRDLSALILVGEKAECRIINVAYGQDLLAGGYGWPDTTYVEGSGMWWKVYPRTEGGEILFRIAYYSKSIYASDTNPFGDLHGKYHTKPSERYILRQEKLPANAELDWKIVPVPGNDSQFRILSAKYDDFMFAHKSETGVNSYRRVLLGRKNFSQHDHIANADRWTLACKPGTYEIPSN